MESTIKFASRYAVFAESHIEKLRKDSHDYSDSDIIFLCELWQSSIEKVEKFIAQQCQHFFPGCQNSEDRLCRGLAARLNAIWRVNGLNSFDEKLRLTRLDSPALWEEIEKQQNRLKSFTQAVAQTSPRDTDYLADVDFLGPIDTRLDVSVRLGWQLPWPENIATLKRICKGKKVLEVNAGCGLWGRLLIENNVNITCTDDVQPFVSYCPIVKKNWYECIAMSDDYDILLMIWPPYSHDQSLVHLVQRFRRKEVIFVGEWYGCTGSENLFHELDSWQAFDYESGCTSHKLTEYVVYEDAVVKIRTMKHWKPNNH